VNIILFVSLCLFKACSVYCTLLFVFVICGLYVVGPPVFDSAH